MNALDAAKRGDLDALRQLPPHSLRATNNNWARSTPAHYAADHGQLEVVQFLHEVVPHTLRATSDCSGTVHL